MIAMVAVSKVKVSPLRTTEKSLRVLAEATEDRLLSGRALASLITLTSMAHPAEGEGDILSSSIPRADLEELNRLGYLKRSDDGTIELI